MRIKLAATVAAVALLFMAAVPAMAETYGFTKITNNGNEDLSAQLFVDVTNPGGGQVAFTFRNEVGISSVVAAVYFDDADSPNNVLASIADISGTTGVNFATPATPPGLPGDIDPDFVVTFSADADNPAPSNGLNDSTDRLTITFNLAGSKTFANVISALDSGALRLGLHVQAIGTEGGSDSYVNNGIIPLPAAVWAGLVLFGGLGVGRTLRRRREMLD